MSYAATSKQNAYFKSLTGQWLPRGCSKSKASSLIDKAKRGEIVKPKDVVRVGGYRFYQPGSTGHLVVSYAVWVNYRMTAQSFSTIEDALAVARAHHPDAEIEQSTSIAEYCPD